MKQRKTWGYICIIVGAVMLFFSHYIAEQIAAGKIQIQQGQKVIKSTESLFSQSKYTKPFGEALTSSGKRRIQAGEADIDKYTKVENSLQIGGIVLIIVGLALVFWRKK